MWFAKDFWLMDGEFAVFIPTARKEMRREGSEKDRLAK